MLSSQMNHKFGPDTKNDALLAHVKTMIKDREIQNNFQMTKASILEESKHEEVSNKIVTGCTSHEK